MNYRKRFTLWAVFLVIASLVLAGCAPTAATQIVPTKEEVTAAKPAATNTSAAVEEPAPTDTAVVETETPTVSEPKVATFIWTQEFDTLNPLYTQMWFSSVTQQLWNCWAWEYNPKNEPYPKLITEMPSLDNGGVSADGKVLTMKLRDDIQWSDGTPITADDFIFTYQMAIEPKNTVNSSYPYDRIASIDAPDPKTVLINFNEPFAPWQATLWKGILPAHILKPIFDSEGTLDTTDWNRAPNVSCGPYIFAEWESGSFARFVVNDNYWLGRPKIDEIYFRFVPDDTAQNSALKAQDGDLGTFISPQDVPSLKDAGLTIMTEPNGGAEGWFFLVNKDLSHPAMMDANVRRALALAFNREKITTDLLFGLTYVPVSFWGEMPEFWKNPAVKGYPYDPEEAKRLLDEAGWKDTNDDGTRDKDGVEFVLRYGTTIRPIRQDAQAVAQQDLAAVGVKLELSSYESDTYFADFANSGPAATGQLDIMEWSDYPAFPDPDIYYWLCSEIPTDEYPSGTNWFFLCDQELDSLIQLQATQINPTERQESIFKIQQIFQDQVYWVGLWNDPDIYAVGPRLKNVSFSGVTPFASIMDWDLTP